MISYGDIDLAAISEAVAAPIEQWLEHQWTSDFHDYIPSPADAWSYNWKTPLELPRIYLGRLHWPVGASRFGYAHMLATDGQLDAIRNKGGGSNLELPLVTDDGTRKITTNMRMPPARPLAQGTVNRELHLLTLVDDRYFYWKRVGVISVTNDVTTWAQLFAAVGTILGITIDGTSSIESDWLKPGDGFATYYGYLPLLLDAAAYAVGRRFVRYLTGAVYLQKATDARTLIAAQADSWPKVAGGPFNF